MFDEEAFNRWYKDNDAGLVWNFYTEQGVTFWGATPNPETKFFVLKVEENDFRAYLCHGIRSKVTSEIAQAKLMDDVKAACEQKWKEHMAKVRGAP